MKTNSKIKINSIRSKFTGAIFICSLLVTQFARATSLDVDTATQTSTGFSTKTNPPAGFDICTYRTQQASATSGYYLGQNCIKLTWTETNYNGTRDGRGIELCGGGAATKEGWMGFKFYPPSPGYPNNKDAGIGQIFQGGTNGCSSWALMLQVTNGVLYVNHRHACVPPTRVQLGSLNYNAWNTVIVHFVASHLNAGTVEVWFNNTTQGSPTYSVTGINFGYGAWDANDTETNDSGLGCKFGMYNYDDGHYTTGETRTIYYDNICKLIGNPFNAWNIVNPNVDGIVDDGTYQVISRHSGKVLDVASHHTGENSNVQQYTYNGGDNQKWTLFHQGNNVYQITGVESGKVLETASTSTTNGVNVDIHTYTGASNQKWTISATDSGYYRLTPVSSSASCADVFGNSTADGANVQQYNYGGGGNQQWIFQAP